jgi:RNA polymerase sigma-70 factor (ECF subfamily)
MRRRSFDAERAAIPDLIKKTCKKPASARNNHNVMTNISATLSGHSMQTGNIDWQMELDRHHRWLKSIVFARLGEPAAVDDVMQEIALAAVRQSAPIQDANKVGPWLYRLAIRQTLLYRRKMGRKRKLTNRYAEKFQPTEVEKSVECNPLQWLLADERQSLVRSAIEQLRPSDAQILMLKYYENWNYHRIAERLGVSHSAVEARLHRARSRLRQLLMNMNVVEEKS